MKVRSDHRSKFSNLSNWKEEAWKKSGLQRDSNPWPPRYRCDALPTELWSHTLGARSIYWVHIFPCSEVMWSLYEIIHICTAVIDESEERDCRFFQWADVKLSRKIRKNKPNDSIEQSPWPGLLEGGWPVMWTRGDHWFPWRQPHMDPTPQRTLETSKSKPCFPSPGAVTQGRRETSHRDVNTRYQSHCDENSNKKKDMNDMVSNWFFSPPKKSPQQGTPPRSARACPRSTKRPPTF